MINWHFCTIPMTIFVVVLSVNLLVRLPNAEEQFASSLQQQGQCDLNTGCLTLSWWAKDSKTSGSENRALVLPCRSWLWMSPFPWASRCPCTLIDPEFRLPYPGSAIALELQSTNSLGLATGGQNSNRSRGPIQQSRVLRGGFALSRYSNYQCHWRAVKHLQL